MAPVPVPEIRAGEDVRVTAAQIGAALATANTRLSRSAAWYDDLRRSLAGGR